MEGKVKCTVQSVPSSILIKQCLVGPKNQCSSIGLLFGELKILYEIQYIAVFLPEASCSPAGRVQVQRELTAKVMYSLHCTSLSMCTDYR